MNIALALSGGGLHSGDVGVYIHLWQFQHVELESIGVFGRAAAFGVDDGDLAADSSCQPQGGERLTATGWAKDSQP